MWRLYDRFLGLGPPELICIASLRGLSFFLAIRADLTWLFSGRVACGMSAKSSPSGARTFPASKEDANHPTNVGVIGAEQRRHFHRVTVRALQELSMLPPLNRGATVLIERHESIADTIKRSHPEFLRIRPRVWNVAQIDRDYAYGVLGTS